MPLFKYFLTVGTILTAGLFALSAYLDPQTSNASARVSVAPTTASLVAIAPAAKVAVAPQIAAAPAPAAIPPAPHKKKK